MSDTETQELEAGSGHEADLPQGDLAYRMAHAAPNLLPGEVRAHPDPWQYVVVAIVLAVITAVEIGVSYMEGSIPDGLIVGAAARDDGGEVLPGRLVVHAPAHRPAGLQAAVRRGRGRGTGPLPGRAGHAARRAAGLSRPADARRRLPELDGASRRLVAGRAVRGRVRHRRRPPRTALVDPRSAGRHPLPGHVLVAGRARDVGGLRLPGPRHRRAVQLQRPHGAAPHLLDGRGAAAAPRPPGVVAAADPEPRVVVLDRAHAVAVHPGAAGLQPRAGLHPLAARGRRRTALRVRPLRGARAAVRVVADRVDADREPAARDPAARSR